MEEKTFKLFQIAANPDCWRQLAADQANIRAARDNIEGSMIAQVNPEMARGYKKACNDFLGES